MFVLLRFRGCESDFEAVKKITEALRVLVGRGRESRCRGLRGLAEAVRVTEEAVRMLLEAVRVIIKAVRRL